MAAPALSEAGVLCEQARALMKARKLAEARAVYEDAIAKDGRHIAAYEGAAAAAFALKDFEGAAAHYKKLTLIDVRRAQPAINLGAVYNRLGDFNSAIKTLRNAITRDKKSAAAYYNLAIAHKGLNQQSMAVTAYKEAVKLDPKMVDASFNLGNLLLEMGSYQQAVMYFQKALEADPTFEKAQRGLERANEAKDESRKSQNAFGRLVDEGAASRPQDEVEHRLLTPAERQEDRAALHELSKETENLGLAVLTQLRDDFGPALQGLSHAASKGDARHLPEENQSLHDAAERFRSIAVALTQKIEAIREHERLIRD